MLDVPRIDDAFKAQHGDGTWRVVIKRRATLSTMTYPFNPLDAVGWQGDLAPVRLNWRDIRPVTSHRYPPAALRAHHLRRRPLRDLHLLPAAAGERPGALKVPFFHNNDDYDEVLFYHAGDFFSRDNIRPGMITLHPRGFTHGPHPKALERMSEAAKPATDEVR